MDSEQRRPGSSRKHTTNIALIFSGLATAVSGANVVRIQVSTPEITHCATSPGAETPWANQVATKRLLQTEGARINDLGQLTALDVSEAGHQVCLTQNQGGAPLTGLIELAFPPTAVVDGSL